MQQVIGLSGDKHTWLVCLIILEAPSFTAKTLALPDSSMQGLLLLKQVRVHASAEKRASRGHASGLAHMHSVMSKPMYTSCTGAAFIT